MEKLYTISIFTENEPGLLHRITTVFTRRHVNLESFTASQTKVESIYRFTIVVRMSYEKVIKIVKQLDKIIGVFNAFLHQEEDVVHQEVALYKLPTSTLVNGKIEEIMRENGGRILSVEPDFLVIEKTGKHNETQDFLEKLQPYGVLEFARSGLVAVMKRNYSLEKYIRKDPEEQVEAEATA